MTTDEKLLTAEEFLHLPPYDGRRELLDGRVVEMAAANGLHAKTAYRFARILGDFVEPRGLGEILVGDPGIFLARNPDRVRCPDICFIAAGRLPHGVPAEFLDVIPDLVVEIRSPGDRAGDVQKKIDEWLQAGVALVLQVDPRTHTVVSVTRDQLLTRREGDVLTCEPVLPDFRVAVAEIFA